LLICIANYSSSCFYLTPGIRLLKLAVVYGANASGKSNFIKVCDYIKKFPIHTPTNKGEEIEIVPFFMDKSSMTETSDLSVSFYVIKENQQPVKYVYKLSLARMYVLQEELCYYPGQQPATIFERTLEHGVSSIKLGNELKLAVQ
jgi:AAA15 family ATPase/GTPase